MDEPFFSIIIPLYNQEKYIEECLNSALNQSFKGKYEIIIVNDGSTDKSEEIINKFKDEKLKIFKNENGGLAFSRNYGNSKAKGEYIIYLDADDILDKNALEFFFETIKNHEPDIVIAPYYAIREHKKDIKLYFRLEKLKNKTGFINIENTNGEILKANFEAWGKAFKKTFIYENKIESPLLRLAEDLPLFYKALFSTDKILLCKKPVYFYRKGHKKPYSKCRHDWVKEAINAILAADEIAKKHLNSKNIEKIYASNTLKVFLYWNKNFKNLENKDEFYKFGIKFLKKWGLSGKFKAGILLENIKSLIGR